ncbi:Uncharacterised protein [Mycobacteroides abscessus subsp. massiliense]|nr:Uncharacterised protein [Mycobacteroides abscessus subsp. massiliense]
MASIWAASPLDVAPDIALVDSRIRFPDSSAKPRASSTPGTSSGMWQPYPVAVESPKIARCRSNSTPRLYLVTGPPPCTYTPSATGGAS